MFDDDKVYYYPQNSPSYQTTAPSSPTVNNTKKTFNIKDSRAVNSSEPKSWKNLGKKDKKSQNKNCNCSISLIFNCF